MPVCTYDIVLYCGRFCVTLAQRGSFGKAFCDPRSGRGSSVPASAQGRLSPIFPQSFCAQAFAVRPQTGQKNHDSLDISTAEASVTKSIAHVKSGVAQGKLSPIFPQSLCAQTLAVRPQTGPKINDSFEIAPTRASAEICSSEFCAGDTVANFSSELLCSGLCREAADWQNKSMIHLKSVRRGQRARAQRFMFLE